MTDILELAKRVEALDGPDSTVAKDIMRALFPDKIPPVIVGNGYGWREDCSGWWLATGEDTRTPPKTIYPPNWLGSLDAAMTLVPEGWLVVHLSELGGAGGCICKLGNPGTSQEALSDSGARTMPLALVAAALRAKEETNEQ